MHIINRRIEANIVAGNIGILTTASLFRAGINVLGFNNRILGNIVGLDKNGNIKKNSYLVGIDLLGGSNNLVQANTIGGNGSSGIALHGGTGTRFTSVGLTNMQLNRVEYNKIGINQFGISAPNDQFGITLLGSTNKKLIAHNTITNNLRGGINLVKIKGDHPAYNGALYPNSPAATPLCNSILYNSIFNNGGLGIDLVKDAVLYDLGIPGSTMLSKLTDNPNANDVFDADSLDDCSRGVEGALSNNFQNHAILDGKRSFTNPALVQVWGSLASKPNRAYLIQVFSSQLKDPSGYGEGQVFVGELEVVTDANGDVNYHFPAKVNVPVGSVITATATDLQTGDTSEFSPWIDVNKKGSPTAYGAASGAAGGDNGSTSTTVDPEMLF